MSLVHRRVFAEFVDERLVAVRVAEVRGRDRRGDTSGGEPQRFEQGGVPPVRDVDQSDDDPSDSSMTGGR